MEKNTNNVLASFKNLEANGRQLASVRRQRRNPYWLGNPKIDFTDFSDTRIWAIIPVWIDANGVMTSIKTGKVITLGRHDDVVHECFGVAYDYEDGTSIIYTRGWKDGKYGLFFTKRTCRDCECTHHRAFGEELTSDPLAKSKTEWWW